MRQTVLIALTVAVVSAAHAKESPPSEADTRAARKTVKELFKTEYAATQPQERVELAHKLANLAEKTTDDVAAQFALFLEARDLAVLGASASAADEIIDRTAERFRIDAPRYKLENLQAISKFATDAAQRREVIVEAAALIRFAIAGDQHDLAQQAATAAVAAAADVPELLSDARLLAERVASASRALNAVKQALETLKTAPEDGEANLTVGKYYCLQKADWARGLPRLALGADATLKALAKAELSTPQTKTSYLALADGWWRAAENADSTEQALMQQRAAHWYRQALPLLNGFSKVRAEKRLESIADAPQVVATPAQVAAETPLHVTADDIRKNLHRNGGTGATERAINLALGWLARSQDAKTGCWNLKGTYADASQYENLDAATGLALLAFVRAGHSQLQGPYHAKVAKGMKFLLERQGNDGKLFKAGPNRQIMYTHGICTLVLSELYQRTGDPSLKSPLERAVHFCAESQDQLGGWRYTPKSDSDTSVTGWMVSGLVTAQQAGVSAPEIVFDRIDNYLTKAAKPGGAIYGYQAGGSEQLAPTAIGLLCRRHTGWEADDPRLLKGADWLLESHMPEWTAKGRDAYYWYYGTRLMQSVGGERWQKWSQPLHDLLLKNQTKSGRESGSWDPHRPIPDKWSEAGRLYTTCLSTYALETYYFPPPEE